MAPRAKKAAATSEVKVEIPVPNLDVQVKVEPVAIETPKVKVENVETPKPVPAAPKVDETPNVVPAKKLAKSRAPRAKAQPPIAPQPVIPLKVLTPQYTTSSITAVEQIRLDINWEIRDFTLVSRKTKSIFSHSVHSHDIGLGQKDAGGVWYLECNPLSTVEDVPWVALFLSHKHPRNRYSDDDDDDDDDEHEVTAKFVLRVLDEQGATVHHRFISESVFEKNGGWGAPLFLKHADIFDPAKKLLTNGTLKIRCDIAFTGIITNVGDRGVKRKFPGAQHQLICSDQPSGAEIDKANKYRFLEGRYIFQPVGFETLGPWGPAAKKFLFEIGKRVAEKTGERRSTEFLRQRISIEIQRGNAASVLGILSDSKGLDAVYYLLSNPGHV